MHSKGVFSAPKICLLCLLSVMLLTSVTSMAQESPSRSLVTGKWITWPPLGTQLNMGSLPMNVALSPDGTYALVNDMGFDRSLIAVNASTGVFVSKFDYTNCNYGQSQTSNGWYYGLTFGKNGLLYVAQGGNNAIDLLNLSVDGILADRPHLMQLSRRTFLQGWRLTREATFVQSALHGWPRTP